MDNQITDNLPVMTAGVDEAGRGPLAGPVVAAAVILDPANPIAGLDDSKKLTERKREQLYDQVISQSLYWYIAQSSVEEIDNINILQATMLAMKRAVEGLSARPEYVLVDGNRLPELKIPAQAIVKGDSRVQAISAASILAKVYRDRMMIEYHGQYPDFSFHKHKAYGSKQHMQELQQYGPTPIHRKSFAPVRRLLEVE